MIHFRSNMTRGEFLDWLRYSAIAGGMPQQFIDRVDDLDVCEGLEAELEKAGDELADAENVRDDALEELKNLRDAVEEHCDNDPANVSNTLANALNWANKALERHSGAG